MTEKFINKNNLGVIMENFIKINCYDCCNDLIFAEIIGKNTIKQLVDNQTLIKNLVKHLDCEITITRCDKDGVVKNKIIGMNWPGECLK